MMGKSKLFLGITAFTLAIATAIASKARQIAVTYYYTTGAVIGQCITVSLAARTDCKIGGPGCFFTNAQDAQYQLYGSKDALNVCQNPIEPIL